MKRAPLYARTKRWLRRNYKLPFRCRVYLRSQESMKKHKAAGLFWWWGTAASIWIENSGNQQAMAEVLIEEWVHGMRQATPMAVDYDGESHDATFWALYGEVMTRWRNEVL